MTTTTKHAVTIRVGTCAVDVQMFLASDARDPVTPGVAAMNAPLPVADWPITPDALASLAAEKLGSCGGSPSSEADCVWAAKNAFMTDMYYVCEARTERERCSDHDRARGQYLRGEAT